MDETETNRLRAHLVKGRNNLRSLFTGLEVVQRELGPEKYLHWCIDNLGVGPDILIKLAGTFEKAEIATWRKEKKAAHKIEKENNRIARIVRTLELAQEAEDKAREAVVKASQVLEKKKHILAEKEQQNQMLQSQK